jgi:hypothetical protein
VALKLRLAVALAELPRSLGRGEECAERLDTLDRVPLIRLLRGLAPGLRPPASLQRAAEGLDRVARDVVQVLGQAEHASERVEVVEARAECLARVHDLFIPPRHEVPASDLIDSPFGEVTRQPTLGPEE